LFNQTIAYRDKKVVGVFVRFSVRRFIASFITWDKASDETTTAFGSN
jgi:hypothetical protein